MKPQRELSVGLFWCEAGRFLPGIQASLKHGLSSWGIIKSSSLVLLGKRGFCTEMGGGRAVQQRMVLEDGQDPGYKETGKREIDSLKGLRFLVLLLLGA